MNNWKSAGIALLATISVCVGVLVFALVVRVRNERTAPDTAVAQSEEALAAVQRQDIERRISPGLKEDLNRWDNERLALARQNEADRERLEYAARQSRDALVWEMRRQSVARDQQRSAEEGEVPFGSVTHTFTDQAGGHMGGNFDPATMR